MNNKEFYKVLAYLVSSARGCLDEPPVYGSLRMIDSVRMLAKLFKENRLVDEQDALLLDKIGYIIEENKFSCMDNEEGFIQMLDDVVDILVED